MTRDGQGERNLATGSTGEALAEAYLREKGYRIIERNFRCRGGEVDIVAREGESIVFVEVKTRRNFTYGVPQLAVTPFKQRQIAKAALTWLAKNRKQSADARFDVLAIMIRPDTAPVIEHIANAFDLPF